MPAPGPVSQSLWGHCLLCRLRLCLRFRWRCIVVVVRFLAIISVLSAAVFVAAANNRTRQARNILLRLRQFALVNLPLGRPTLGHAVGAVVKKSLGRRFLWKFRRRCLHYPAIPFYRSGRRGVRVDPTCRSLKSYAFRGSAHRVKDVSVFR